MYCPVCQGEYRADFDRCSACDVALVAELPREPEPDHPESAELLVTANVPFLGLVKSLLDSEGIPYSVQGEQALGLVTVLPSSHFSSPDSFGARLFVPADRLEAARTLIDSMEELDEDSLPEA